MDTQKVPDMIIAKHFEFEASHQLPNEECYGKCRNLHGHTYKLTVKVAGQLTEKGWVANFSEVKKVVMDKIVDRLDHSHLNESTGLPITTAENLLFWMENEIREDLKAINCRLHSMVLYETSKSFAELILE